jgi:hypothetical protein
MWTLLVAMVMVMAVMTSTIVQIINSPKLQHTRTTHGFKHKTIFKRFVRMWFDSF